MPRTRSRNGANSSCVAACARPPDSRVTQRSVRPISVATSATSSSSFEKKRRTVAASALSAGGAGVSRSTTIATSSDARDASTTRSFAMPTRLASLHAMVRAIQQVVDRQARRRGDADADARADEARLREARLERLDRPQDLRRDALPRAALRLHETVGRLLEEAGALLDQRARGRSTRRRRSPRRRRPSSRARCGSSGRRGSRCSRPAARRAGAASRSRVRPRR